MKIDVKFATETFAPIFGSTTEIVDGATFWNGFTSNGSRTFYEYAFRQSGFEYIQPPIQIKPSGCRSISMFHDCKSLRKIEKKYFDLSGVTVASSANTSGHYNTFYNCAALEEVEDIGLPAGGYYYTFFACRNLHTLEVFRVTADTKFTNPFGVCVALQNITIDGTIGQSGLNFSWSPLTHDSLMSIINALGVTDSALSITLGTDNLAKLTDAEKAVATQKGWTLA